MNTFFALLRDERGAALTEYALVLALLSLVAITALKFVGVAIGQKLIDLANQLTAGQSG